MQRPGSQRASCRVCHVGRGDPCVTADGYIAERTHWGRPYEAAKESRIRNVTGGAASALPRVYMPTPAEQAARRALMKQQSIGSAR